MMSLPLSIINSYRNLFSDKIKNFNEVANKNYPIPRFTEENIKKLIDLTISTLQNDETLIELEWDVVVVGDIHGALADLLRIFHNYGAPPLQRYVFLGDYVDRGEYSYEVVILLFALKCQYPRNIYLLRGNHEFKDINSMYGFKEECVTDYSEVLFELFNEAFSYLPLAALSVNDRILMIHGGIGQTLTAIEQIARIKRPSLDFEKTPYLQIVKDIVWSDPSSGVQGFKPSFRGMGTLFGNDELNRFLTSNNLSTIIRGHQCISNGAGKFENMNIYTVFSCSNYSSGASNLSGVIRIKNGAIECACLPPLDRIPRDQACFKFVDAELVNQTLHSIGSSFSNYHSLKTPFSKSKLGLVKRVSVSCVSKKDSNEPKRRRTYGGK